MSSANISSILTNYDALFKQDIVALLYSDSQNAFHVESFADYTKNSMMRFLSNERNDYVLLWVFDNRSDCDKILKEVVGIRNDRQKAENFVENLLNSMSL